MACSLHPQQQASFVCVHKPCPKRFEPICSKCRSTDHSSHSAKILPLAQFIKNLTKLEKEMQKHEVRKENWFKVPQQLVLLNQFHKRIQELEKSMLKIWVDAVDNRKEQRRIRAETKQIIADCLEKCKTASLNSSEMREALKRSQNIFQYNFNKAKLVLINTNLKQCQSREQKMKLSLQPVESSIKEYMVKIIEVFLDVDQSQNSNQEELLEVYLLGKLREFKQQENKCKEQFKCTKEYFNALFPQEFNQQELLQSQLNPQFFQQLKDTIQQLKQEKESEVRLRGVLSKENKNLKQQMQRIKAQMRDCKQKMDKMLTQKQNNFNDLSLQQKSLLQQLDGLKLWKQDILKQKQKLQEQINRLNQQSTTLNKQKGDCLAKLNVCERQVLQLRAVLSQKQQIHKLSVQRVSISIIQSEEKIRQREFILNKLVMENQELTTKNTQLVSENSNLKSSRKEVQNRQLYLIKRQFKTQPDDKPQSIRQGLLSEVGNFQNERQKQSQTDIKVVYRLLNKVIGDLNTLQLKVKEQEGTETAHHQELEAQKSLISQLRYQIQESKRKTTLSRVRSEFLSPRQRKQ